MNVIAVEKLPREIYFQCASGKGKVIPFAPKIIRFVLTSHQEFDLDFSYAVNKPLENWPDFPCEIVDDAQQISIKTSELTIKITKIPYKVQILCNGGGESSLCEDAEGGMGACFNAQTSGIRSYKKIRDNEHFFGFGEKTGPLDKRGKDLQMLNRDLPYRKERDPMYQSHPFFISMSGGVAYAIFFDNISKTTFEMGKTNQAEYYFDAAKGDLNYYFIYGPSIEDILAQYTELTGHMEMPPKWAIGYHQCRDSYKTEEQIRAITTKFRANQVPCDGIWFDIHYMEGFRVFTFNSGNFPDPQRLMADLKSQGFKPVVIVDPGVKVDPNDLTYQELMENQYFTPNAEGAPSIGLVWPGITHFPDFTRDEVQAWWAGKHKFYFDAGIEGIWNDMNEPAFSVNPFVSWRKRLPHKDMYLHDQGRHTWQEHARNVYGLCEAKATWTAFQKFKPNQRPFILTRAGYAGVQRYAASWTGDNWTAWSSISVAIRMLLNLNLSAQAFVGSDIGGFVGITKYLFRNKAQFIRWIQTGVFYPFCRVHSFHLGKSQDPFSFGKKVQEIAKKYIQLRYELLPYWYSLFRAAHETGKPIMRPLFYETPRDEKCYYRYFENQFFLGRDILIIPIDRRRARTKQIYLPEGSWIHYWTLEELAGKEEHRIPIRLDDIPIFIRKGAIISTQPVLEYNGQKPVEVLILKIYRGKTGTTGSISIYEDDGESMDYQTKNIYCFLDVTVKYEETGIILELNRRGNYIPPWKVLKYVVFDKGAKSKEGTLKMQEKIHKINL